VDLEVLAVEALVAVALVEAGNVSLKSRVQSSKTEAVFTIKKVLSSK